MGHSRPLGEQFVSAGDAGEQCQEFFRQETWYRQGIEKRMDRGVVDRVTRSTVPHFLPSFM